MSPACFSEYADLNCLFYYKFLFIKKLFLHLICWSFFVLLVCQYFSIMMTTNIWLIIILFFLVQYYKTQIFCVLKWNINLMVWKNFYHLCINWMVPKLCSYSFFLLLNFHFIAVHCSYFICKILYVWYKRVYKFPPSLSCVVSRDADNKKKTFKK